MRRIRSVLILSALAAGLWSGEIAFAQMTANDANAKFQLAFFKIAQRTNAYGKLPVNTLWLVSVEPQGAADIKWVKGKLTPAMAAQARSVIEQILRDCPKPDRRSVMLFSTRMDAFGRPDMIHSSQAGWTLESSDTENLAIMATPHESIETRLRPNTNYFGPALCIDTVTNAVSFTKQGFRCNLDKGTHVYLLGRDLCLKSGRLTVASVGRQTIVISKSKPGEFAHWIWHATICQGHAVMQAGEHPSVECLDGEVTLRSDDGNQIDIQPGKTYRDE